jgi:hypothetical protein
MGGAEWHTRISSFKFPSCMAAPPPDMAPPPEPMDLAAPPPTAHDGGAGGNGGHLDGGHGPPPGHGKGGCGCAVGARPTPPNERPFAILFLLCTMATIAWWRKARE